MYIKQDCCYSNCQTIQKKGKRAKKSSDSFKGRPPQPGLTRKPRVSALTRANSFTKGRYR